MITDRFLFVAYKRESADYCRGCLMERYRDDHILENMLTTDDLVSKWADVIYKNLNLRINEARYCVWVFKNGIRVWNENYADWDAEYCFDELSEADEFLKSRDMTEISDLFQTAQTKAEAMQSDKKERERQAEVNRKANAAAQAKNKRRQEFEKLKKEFEP